jgi:hypothetical protein
MLTNKDCTKLEIIQDRIISNTLITNEKTAFLDLIVKSGRELKIRDYMRAIGFNSITEIKEYLSKNKKNNELTIAGGAILSAFLLNR